MKNKICLVYLAVVPYLILAMVTVHWYEYYRPSPTTLAFEPFLFVFTILMYPVIGVLLALLHIIPKSVYGTKWARSIMAVNFMVRIGFWSIYYSGDWYKRQGYQWPGQCAGDTEPRLCV